MSTVVLATLADGPQLYSAVMAAVGKHIASDRSAYEGLRVPVSRAVKRLVAAGKINRDGNTLSVVMKY